MEQYQERKINAKEKNKRVSFSERAAELVSQMTAEEKIAQLGKQAPGIQRLGIPKYNYWSEASHGYFGPFKLRKMDVTSYPVCLAMSQSWDRELIEKVASAISDECRAYYNMDGDEQHFWCPTINLARDPRNGRSDENFGEDPFLTGQLAASYVRGMQGNDEKYLKTVATPKHFALNSSENNRHRGSSNVDEATMREYYLKPFEYVVKDAKAASIMTSYNRVNGIPASCNEKLLEEILREEWGFDGFVVSDCGAIADCYENPTFVNGAEKLSGHYYAKNMEEASAMSLLAGTDMCGGTEYKESLGAALQKGWIQESDLDRALIRIFTSRFQLGLLEEQKPFSKLGKEQICNKEMQELSIKMAKDTIVLLKNEKDLLPLKKEEGKIILVIGPNAIYRELGGYSAGETCKLVDTVVNTMMLEGINREVSGSGMQVIYEKGWCTGKERNSGVALLPGAADTNGQSMSKMESFKSMVEEMFGEGTSLRDAGMAFMSPDRYCVDDPDCGADDTVLFQRALAEAEKADYCIVVAGTDSTTASEEHDRISLELPYGQNEKIEQLLAVNPNTVVVLNTLGAVTGTFFEKAHTVLNVHFAGQKQGVAVADILFGNENPNGKLTATWYRSQDDLPDINDYGIRKQDTMSQRPRTYQYIENKPLFPFGHGCSYTEFKYSSMKINLKSVSPNDTLEVQVDVANTGHMDGAEIVQVYVSKVIPEGTYDNKPVRQLKGFEKIFVPKGERITVQVPIAISELIFWSNFHKKMIVEPGVYKIEIGKSSEDIVFSETISIEGEWEPSLQNVCAKVKRQILESGMTEQIQIAAVLADTTRLQKGQMHVTYQSSDTAVIQVNSDGWVTAGESGTASVKMVVEYNNQIRTTEVAFAVKQSDNR